MKCVRIESNIVVVQVVAVVVVVAVVDPNHRRTERSFT